MQVYDTEGKKQILKWGIARYGLENLPKISFLLDDHIFFVRTGVAATGVFRIKRKKVIYSTVVGGAKRDSEQNDGSRGAKR